MGDKKSFIIVILEFIGNMLYKHINCVLLFIHTLLILRIVQVLYKIRNFNYFYIVILFIVGLLIYKLYRNLLINRARKILFTISVLFIISCTTFIYRASVAKYLGEVIKQYTLIQESFYNSKDTYFYQYVPFLTVLIPIIIAGAGYLASKGFEQILLLLSILYMFNLWYIAELHEVKTYALIYIAVTCVAYGWTKFSNFLRQLKGEGIKLSLNSKKVLQFVIVLSLAGILFTYVSSQLFGVKDVFTRLEERRIKSKSLLKKTFNNRYDLSGSGYPDSAAGLGGSVELSFDRVFTVKSDEPLYLKGRALDLYDGFKWTKSEDKYVKLTEMPYLFYSKSFETAEVKKLTVYPETVKISTLFAPSFTFNLSLAEGQVGRDKLESFIIIGSAAVDKPYIVEYYSLKDGVENFTRTYSNNNFIEYKTGDQNVISRYGNYLQLPNNISKETYSLVMEIIKDCNNTSDKVKAIQDYLSKNYKYSLKTADLPEGREFVDYFLFTEKKGYCTYFATAAAIMCRAAGIPARYVEGFRMTGKRDSYGLYEVTNDMAHAWTEVLFNADEDIWSIVEATPGAEHIYAQINQEESRPITSNSNLDNGRINKVNFFSNINVNAIIACFALMLLSSIIAFVIIRLVNSSKLKKSVLDSGSKIPLYYYVRNRIKFIYESNKVPEDDLVWIENTEDKELKEVLLQLITSVYSEFYGKQTSAEFDNHSIYCFIETFMKKTQGKFKYYICKFINF